MDLKDNFLTIDSRDRNKETYPTPSTYVYFLYDVIKNVEKVELVYALYEKVGTEFYVNLHIDEFPNNVLSNNTTIRGAFMQLPLITYMNEFAADKFTSSQSFQKPISKLSRLSIKFMSYDGSLYPMKEHLLVFRVTYFTYTGNMDFNANGSLHITHPEDECVFLLELPANYNKEQLNAAYTMKKSSLRSREAPMDELVKLKRAYKVLYYRLKE
jgi:hypothetical protein